MGVGVLCGMILRFRDVGLALIPFFDAKRDKLCFCLGVPVYDLPGENGSNNGFSVHRYNGWKRWYIKKFQTPNPMLKVRVTKTPGSHP